MTRILIVDDEETSCRTLKLHFGQQGFDVDTVPSAGRCLEYLDENEVDLIISDIQMPGQDGLSLLQEIHSRSPDLPVIIITAFHSLESTVAAMRGGAVDYVTKPINLKSIEAAVERIIFRRTKTHGDGYVFSSDPSEETIVGKTTIMSDVFKAIGMVSQSFVTVLLLGESGTGKELAARAIHRASDVSESPFIAVNCAALVETLLESELFGHVRGAFTGAVSSRVGKVELAGDGTLFLDEIGELSPQMQGKLLRLLEEREYHTVGGTKTRKCSARFIAATNVDLKARVDSGKFREDLYYRLNVVKITLPPLRDRREDIPLLVEHLLHKINSQFYKGVTRVSAETMQALVNYDWPGNVRQLKNALVKAVVMDVGDTLNLTNLPKEIVSQIPDNNGRADMTDKIPDEEDDETHIPSLKEVEERHIKKVLNNAGWHKGKACQILGISRPKLERRLVEYGIKK